MSIFEQIHQGTGPRAAAAGAAMTALAIVKAAPAKAQTTPPPAPALDASAAPAEGDVAFTGTRIQRIVFQAPTPLTVLTQQEIESQSPTNNIADFVNQQPALARSTRPASSRLN